MTVTTTVRTTNLDRSGGNVFRSMTGPAMLE